ncbi:PRD domain-containing protein [Paenibacillus sp. N1-5-1-14]|uniref:PRD domain-containing protein n=1 Tax=Paenibacillus radicibacter TaxID=2972488 RepID=UPI0021594593|nr:PRD domain-containing protein [Paenibacillus radicibacter]MCR8643703.1 PRD domain-containing protein [Paenibacillus radicibacter]
MITRKIVHVLSHNVVMAKLSTGKNSIVFGKGIGFKRTPGMKLDESEVSQEFLIHTSEVLEHYEQVLSSVDAKIIGVTEEVIAYAHSQLAGDFSETIHAALVDHINFAVERTRRGIAITNPFAYEIQHLYSEEYDIAKRAVVFLNTQLDVELPDDEIAFLAMHFHASRSKTRTVDSLELVRLVSQIIEEAKTIGIQFESSFSTIRFISHLKSLIDRVRNQKSIQNPLLSKIKEECSASYEKAKQLSVTIEKKLQLPVVEDEIGFLTLHIERFNVPVK